MALMEELYPKFNAIEAQVVGGLSSRRKQEMTSSLRAIVTAIEADTSRDRPDRSRRTPSQP